MTVPHCPASSLFVPQNKHGVQGVASSNPATPTIENQRVSSHKGLARFAWCGDSRFWLPFGCRLEQGHVFSGSARKAGDRDEAQIRACGAWPCRRRAGGSHTDPIAVRARSGAGRCACRARQHAGGHALRPDRGAAGGRRHPAADDPWQRRRARPGHGLGAPARAAGHPCHRDVALRLPAHAVAGRCVAAGAGRSACVPARRAGHRPRCRHGRVRRRPVGAADRLAAPAARARTDARGQRTRRRLRHLRLSRLHREPHSRSPLPRVRRRRPLARRARRGRAGRDRHAAGRLEAGCLRVRSWSNGIRPNAICASKPSA